MTRTRGVMIAVLALIACSAAAATGLAVLRDDPGATLSGVPGLGGPRSDGPMRELTEHGMEAHGAQGSKFTDGLEVLYLDTDEPAELLRIETVGGEGTFRQVGALLAGPERSLAANAYMRGYPPDRKSLGEVIEAEGATVLPFGETQEMGYELLIGYEIVDDTQVGYRTGVSVTYRIGDTDYEWYSPARLLYCPEGMDAEECTRVAEADDWGE